jgi:hypothetical protein
VYPIDNITPLFALRNPKAYSVAPGTGFHWKVDSAASDGAHVLANVFVITVVAQVLLIGVGLGVVAGS